MARHRPNLSITTRVDIMKAIGWRYPLEVVVVVVVWGGGGGHVDQVEWMGDKGH